MSPLSPSRSSAPLRSPVRSPLVGRRPVARLARCGPPLVRPRLPLRSLGALFLFPVLPVVSVPGVWPAFPRLSLSSRVELLPPTRTADPWNQFCLCQEIAYRISVGAGLCTPRAPSWRLIAGLSQRPLPCAACSPLYLRAGKPR